MHFNQNLTKVYERRLILEIEAFTAKTINAEYCLIRI